METVYVEDQDVKPVHDFSGNSRDIAWVSGIEAIYKTGIKNGQAAYLFSDPSVVYVTNTGKQVSQPYHVFIVAYTDTNPDQQVILDSYSAVTRFQLIGGNAPNLWKAAAGVQSPGVAITDGWHILELLVNGVSSSWLLDGTSVWTGNLGTVNFSLARLANNAQGLGSGYENYICLWGVHPGAIAAGDLTVYRNYLSTRYDIAVA